MKAIIERVDGVYLIRFCENNSGSLCDTFVAEKLGFKTENNEIVTINSEDIELALWLIN